MFFHALTFAGSWGIKSSLNTRLQGRVVKRFPRDTANVNAMKQTCDCYSYILPYSSRKLHSKCQKIIQIVIFHTLNLIVTGLQNQTSQTSFLLTMLTSTKAQTKCLFRAANFCCVMSCKQTFARLEDFQVKTMFKQHIFTLPQTFLRSTYFRPTRS